MQQCTKHKKIHYEHVYDTGLMRKINHNYIELEKQQQRNEELVKKVRQIYSMKWK